MSNKNALEYSASLWFCASPLLGSYRHESASEDNSLIFNLKIAGKRISEIASFRRHKISIKLYLIVCK